MPSRDARWHTAPVLLRSRVPVSPEFALSFLLSPRVPCLLFVIGALVASGCGQSEPGSTTDSDAPADVSDTEVGDVGTDPETDPAVDAPPDVPPDGAPDVDLDTAEDARPTDVSIDGESDAPADADATHDADAPTDADATHDADAPADADPDADADADADLDVDGPCPEGFWGPRCDEICDCDDELFCNGLETCDRELGCLDGPPPTVSDDIPCTIDECDEVDDVITHVPDDGLCDDLDPCTADFCSETGCGAAVLPDASECDDCGSGACACFARGRARGCHRPRPVW